MPLYMDRHDLPGVSAEGIADAHILDLKIQSQYGCNAMTYWVDTDRGHVFCLIDAPNIQAVKEMHNNSHGSIPHEIREVNSELVNSFLGRIHDPEMDPGKDNDSVLVITESAFRAILITDIKDRKLLASQHGLDFSNSTLHRFHEQIRNLAQEYSGSIVDNQNEYLLSFNSVTHALEFALALQEYYNLFNTSANSIKIEIQTGISAGVPVTKNSNLFGDTVDTARILSKLSKPGIVNISAKIKDFYKGQFPDKINSISYFRVYPEREEDFLQKLMNTIQDSIQSEEYKLDHICKKMGLSKSNLYRKIVSLTGYSPNDFIMELRLQKSVEWMHQRKSNISETSYELGFSNPSYFSKCFKMRFGILPAEFLKSLE
jgi:AraC-like DNA-binding protein